MEEWKYEDFEKWINSVKAHSDDPSNIWSEITREIMLRKGSIPTENLDSLFYNTFKNKLLSSSDLSKFFMVVHMYGHPWRLFSDGYRELFAYLDKPIIDAFSISLFHSLPDSIKVFRALNGIRKGDVNLDNPGLCWSLDKDIAIETFGGDYGVLLSGKCNKKSIIACFNYRFEKEVVVDPSDVYDLETSEY